MALAKGGKEKESEQFDINIECDSIKTTYESDITFTITESGKSTIPVPFLNINDVDSCGTKFDKILPHQASDNVMTEFQLGSLKLKLEINEAILYVNTQKPSTYTFMM